MYDLINKFGSKMFAGQIRNVAHVRASTANSDNRMDNQCWLVVMFSLLIALCNLYLVLFSVGV